MNISKLVHEAHRNAVAKGWWDKEPSFGEVIALIHSEGSEALEDYRNGRGITEVWYENKEYKTRLDCPITQDCKPCGIPSELADICIRIFDAAGKYGWGPILEAATSESIDHCFRINTKFASFPEHLTSIHFDLSQAWINYERGGEQGAIKCLAYVLNEVNYVAVKYKIDLDKAITEKMSYNATRPHRHGGKVL
jgi:hypothetical protein